MATNICRSLWNEFSSQDNLAGFAVHTAILDLTGLLNRVKIGRAISPPNWLEKAREYLDAYCTSSMSLPQLSRAVERHPTHVSREFRRWYGKSMIQFVRERRILRAREMLLLPERSIADISSACGFYDQSHLTTAFRRQFGYTPAQYRLTRVHG
ncbi:helix-turn-helix transcriptional regulator [Acidicapsa dinghuensis]|uniref:Helix-turn-helix transcriptional regulator n=1 Tax=Acidicapsa dinghuensis TaxID=2218256 RepID=A0ABW1EFW4_9BACT|nr:helix-turn-helix transcriptional regulator [Acidicapsa dinghuensis]